MSAQRLARIADELRAHANLGLLYVQDAHDLSRYRRVLELSAELAALPAPQDEALVLPELKATYLRALSHVCPLLGAEALVLRGGQVLLMRRRDNGLWGLPGGLVEVGETLASAAARELLEETGLSGRPSRLLLLSDTHHDGGSTLHIVSATFLVEADGDPRPTLEASEVGWFTPGEWPALHPGQPPRLTRALAALASGETSFDAAEHGPHPPQQHSEGGQPPKSNLLVWAARQLLRTVIFGEVRRKTQQPSG